MGTEGGLVWRPERLREKRFAEDDRQVCMERACILKDTKETLGHLSHVARQAAITRELCERISCVIEPEDLIVGRMPEEVPTAEGEAFIAGNPELFCEAGVPGWLDSLGIYIPDWDRLVERGIGGLASDVRGRLGAIGDGDEDADRRREFLAAAVAALEAVSLLIRRYAEEARRCLNREEDAARAAELAEIAERCDRLAWEPAAGFVDALQLIQLMHMTLSCLVGGRDVTPGRLDQYLLPLYADDLAQGRLDEGDAATLLAMFFLRLSQMGGSGTDFDDSVRRTPCKYTHIYVTVGGVDPQGKSGINALTYVIIDAIRLLEYREPTLLVRYCLGSEERFAAEIAELVRRRLPVTIYNDAVVVRALTAQGVSLVDARGYAHSACHNVLVVGREAGSAPGGFHNMPKLVLLAMNGGHELSSDVQIGELTPPPEEIETFEQFRQALMSQVRFLLRGVRQTWDKRWERSYSQYCPLLPSALMEHSVDQGKPCWQSAPVSHFNHHLMGLATAVDSLVAIRKLVFEDRVLRLDEFVDIVRADWDGHEALRQRIRMQLPRYGQSTPEGTEIAAMIGGMWVDEVEAASRGMNRCRMWPGFYSHLVHARYGCEIPATPDGRRANEPLSENVGPSYGTPRVSPTSILGAMSALPFDHTPSGAATLTLPATGTLGQDGLGLITALVDGYFRDGGLHLQFNVLDAGRLEEAMAHPERHSDLIVRVTGFSAYFTRLTRNVQEDLVRRYQRDVQ
ncbi:MAG: hypothetical protein HON70_08185 [Lentisphaerae bacterium]|nr:hypothetical protein [Lentisphaerota bacterium]